ncbi:baseplate hub subunit and tail lysozyme [Escherichia phage EcS1]|uniref:Pre-baseplate central spike protein n=1 Tax=Escherichia phage EcS1 TaxID=2083276 RepID=A0A2Z5ZC53_9CAUD|nr:baseplate hub subunit and tail lysozyme [Escherichia phage EcS1]BBC78218.1 Baseplate hub + tail lysozyme [Escherichia phage EcS1]
MLNMNTHVEWFVGVVEDRMDPLEQGRVRTRVYGLHPYQKTQGNISGVPTAELPWMSILQGTNSAAISGVQSAITGMVEGTHVFGLWLDEYKLNGLIIGTYSSNSKTKPNFNEGFSDPTGQYPRYLGNDTNPLNRGGESGFTSTPNVIQDANLDTGINPDDTDLSDIPEDDNPDYTIQAMLRRDEGLRLKVYWDSEGYPTIGIGHLIMTTKTRNMDEINKALSNQIKREVRGNPGSISMDEAVSLFQQDLKKMQDDITKNSTVGPVYAKMNKSRKMALENMSFQMGVGGLAKFTNMLAAMFIGDWTTAYNEARDSTWYNQTKGRASRVSMIILVGNMESYGIPVSTSTPKSLSAAATVRTSSDPSDPWTPTDSRILFKEPISSYKGQYPYVQSMETEGGHIQEFDNTPGQERYRLSHPTGSYEEVAPDGRRTIKTVADGYYITNGDGNTLISGDNKVNVGGDEVYYNMSSRRQQIDGNQEIFIRGNDTCTVEGDGTLIVKGNIKIVVEGDADIEVQGNAKSHVVGNHEYTVDGNLVWKVAGTVDMQAGGAWTQTMASMSSKAAGQYTIDGSRIDIG